MINRSSSTPRRGPYNEDSLPRTQGPSPKIIIGQQRNGPRSATIKLTFPPGKHKNTRPRFFRELFGSSPLLDYNRDERCLAPHPRTGLLFFPRASGHNYTPGRAKASGSPGPKSSRWVKAKTAYAWAIAPIERVHFSAIGSPPRWFRHGGARDGAWPTRERRLRRGRSPPRVVFSFAAGRAFP